MGGQNIPKFTIFVGKNHFRKNVKSSRPNAHPKHNSEISKYIHNNIYFRSQSKIVEYLGLPTLKSNYGHFIRRFKCHKSKSYLVRITLPLAVGLSLNDLTYNIPPGYLYIC